MHTYSVINVVRSDHQNFSYKISKREAKVLHSKVGGGGVGGIALNVGVRGYCPKCADTSIHFF
jgi:hypothetical protein